MKSTVIKNFIDKDTLQGYSVGNTFESDDSERIAYLVEKGFLKGKTEEEQFPKHTGGGWYELSNGEKVQGKDEAATAEKELQNRGE